MNLYVLTFEIGISSGVKYFLGLYDTEDKALQARENHMQKHGYMRDYYIISEVELNREENILFAEW